jgi:tetratricopeptide (TPR) repeat protein
MHRWLLRLALAVVVSIAGLPLAAQEAFPESVQDGIVVMRFAEMTRPGVVRFEQVLAAFDEINQPYIVIEAQVRDKREAANLADRYNALAILDGFQTSNGSFRMRVTWSTRAAQLLLADPSAVAEDILEETLTLTPDMSPSFVSDYMRGNIFYTLGDDENALRFLELAYFGLPRGKELESEALQLFVTYGDLLNRFNEYRRTVEVISYAIQLDPQFAYSYFVQARALRFLGRLDEALASINRALELGNRTSYFNELGRIHIIREEYAQAEAAYNRTLEIKPNDATALAGLGDVAYFSGNIEGSIPFFQRATEADPTYSYAPYSWAYSLFDLGRFAEAERVVLRALEVNPEYVEALLLYGDILWAQGKRPAAVEQYRLYLDLGGEPLDYVLERVR